ncbi:MAG: UDP-N-acetylmuramate dehydrogenase [Armatimonadota bacterium]
MTLYQNHSLAGCSTLKIGGIAPYFAAIETEYEVKEIIETARASSHRILCLGAGSNTLIGDLPDDALVLKITGTNLQTDGTKMYAQAGTYLPALAKAALHYGLSGLEWAVNVPGTLGGSIVMNAGAFAEEIIDRLLYVRAMTHNGEAVTLFHQDIEASHRWTNIDPSKYIVLGACLQLTAGDRERIGSLMRSFRDYRFRTQPRGRTLGSTFKRHYDSKNQCWVSAGYYLDQCQLKGFSVGGAKISEVHANFIMNSGSATWQDVVTLIAHARSCVQKCFGILLELEIKLWVDTHGGLFPLQ